MQPSLNGDIFVICCRGIEPSIGQGEDVREESEDPWEDEVKGEFCEDTPGEDEENSDDHFDDGKEPPSCDVGDR